MWREVWSEDVSRMYEEGPKKASVTLLGTLISSSLSSLDGTLLMEAVCRGPGAQVRPSTQAGSVSGGQGVVEVHHVAVNWMMENAVELCGGYYTLLMMNAYMLSCFNLLQPVQRGNTSVHWSASCSVATLMLVGKRYPDPLTTNHESMPPNLYAYNSATPKPHIVTYYMRPSS
jgi:hypothetical protein